MPQTHETRRKPNQPQKLDRPECATAHSMPVSSVQGISTVSRDRCARVLARSVLAPNARCAPLRPARPPLTPPKCQQPNTHSPLLDAPGSPCRRVRPPRTTDSASEARTCGRAPRAPAATGGASLSRAVACQQGRRKELTKHLLSTARQRRRNPNSSGARRATARV